MFWVVPSNESCCSVTHSAGDSLDQDRVIGVDINLQTQLVVLINQIIIRYYVTGKTLLFGSMTGIMMDNISDVI